MFFTHLWHILIFNKKIKKAFLETCILLRKNIELNKYKNKSNTTFYDDKQIERLN